MLHPEDEAGRRLLKLTPAQIPAEVETMIRTLYPAAEKRYRMAVDSLSQPTSRGRRMGPLIAALLCLEGMAIGLRAVGASSDPTPKFQLLEAMTKASNEGALCLLAGWECIEASHPWTLPNTHPAMAYRASDTFLRGRITAMQSTLRRPRFADRHVDLLTLKVEAGQTGLTGGDL